MDDKAVYFVVTYKNEKADTEWQVHETIFSSQEKIQKWAEKYWYAWTDHFIRMVPKEKYATIRASFSDIAINKIVARIYPVVIY